MIVDTLCYISVWCGCSSVHGKGPAFDQRTATQGDKDVRHRQAHRRRVREGPGLSSCGGRHGQWPGDLRGVRGRLG